MKDNDAFRLFCFVLFLLYILFTRGFDAFWKIVCSFSDSFILLLGFLNQVIFQLTDDYLLTLIFQPSITYALVGILFEILCVPRGKFGSIIGKSLFWVIGISVSIILNFVCKCIF